ncbi:MAG: hypothetical protein LBF55_06760, partial [Prevotellaceae bacterium]|nr:hypothetical protein [Prevotellaceae bacterium]
MKATFLSSITFLLSAVGLQAADQDQDQWTPGTGVVPISIASFFNLDTLSAEATLHYRIIAYSDGYADSAMVLPQDSLAIPTRRAAPAADSAYHFDYAREEVAADSSLQLMGAGQPGWTSVAADSAWTFADAGWGEGSAAVAFLVRFPADTAVGAFASLRAQDTIPARPDTAPPVGRTIINGDGSTADMVVTKTTAGTSYDYRKSDTL